MTVSSEQYSRLESLLGREKLDRISKATILIAGLGGVGGHALDALVRSGVSSFILIDADKFEESNLNRQLLSKPENIGNYKAEVAKSYILSINENAKVEAYNSFIDQSNIEHFLNMNPTVVVDAIDSVSSKCLLLSECKKRGIKIVSSMGAALKADPTLVRSADLSQTSSDHLAKTVRSVLKKQYNITEGIPCVYSLEKTPVNSNNTLGSFAPVTGTFGLVLAKLALEEL